MAAGDWVRRGYPARQFSVSGPHDVALATVLGSMERLKFRARTAPGGHPVVFEYGSVGSLLLDTWGLSLFPGRAGKRLWAVVDWSRAGDITAFTVSHVIGRAYGSPVATAIDRMLAAFDAAGVLVSVAEPTTAFDLPPESIGNATTFRGSGYLSPLDRWVTS